MHLYEVAVRYMCREFITTIKLAEERTYYNVRQLKLWHIAQVEQMIVSVLISLKYQY
jgi:hypothetical protein